MRYPHTASIGTTKQMVTTAVPASIDSGRTMNTNRVLLMASVANAYVGWGPGLTTANGAAIPTTCYLELWVEDPGDVFIIGAINQQTWPTVYIVFEQPEKAQV